MDLRVDSEAMQALVAKSLIDALTPDQRDKLMQQAITNLLMQSPDSTNTYRGDTRSYLQRAFDQQVVEVANKIVREQFENDAGFKANIQKLFADVAARLFAENMRETMVSSMADMIVRGLGRDR